MPRFRRPSEYAHDARALKQIGNDLGIDSKGSLRRCRRRVKQLAPACSTSNADSRQSARTPGSRCDYRTTGAGTCTSTAAAWRRDGAWGQ